MTPLNPLPNPRKHHYLVTGEIHYGIEDNYHMSRLNAVVTHDEKKVPAKIIGRAQQTLQMNFFKRVEDPTKIKVEDVIIVGLTYLGEFTESEFVEGLQEKTK